MALGQATLVENYSPGEGAAAFATINNRLYAAYDFGTTSTTVYALGVFNLPPRSAETPLVSRIGSAVNYGVSITGFTAMAAVGTNLYAADFDDTYVSGFALYRINTTTGVATLSGGVTTSDSQRISDVTNLASLGNDLFTINNDNYRLYSINPQTLQATYIGKVSVGTESIQGLAGFGSDLYLVTNDNLYKVNPTNANTQRVGSQTDFGAGITIASGLSFVGSVLYMTANDGNNVGLYTLEYTAADPVVPQERIYFEPSSLEVPSNQNSFSVDVKMEVEKQLSVVFVAISVPDINISVVNLIELSQTPDWGEWVFSFQEETGNILSFQNDGSIPSDVRSFTLGRLTFTIDGTLISRDTSFNLSIIRIQGDGGDDTNSIIIDYADGTSGANTIQLGTAAITFVSSVTPPVVTPVIAAISNVSQTVGYAQFTIQATLSSGTVGTWTITGTGASINTAGLITINAGLAAGTYSFTVTNTNTAGNDTETFDVIVSAAVTPPDPEPESETGNFSTWQYSPQITWDFRDLTPDDIVFLQISSRQALPRGATSASWTVILSRALFAGETFEASDLKMSGVSNPVIAEPVLVSGRTYTVNTTFDVITSYTIVELSGRDN